MQLLLFLQCSVSVPQVNVNTRSNYQAIEHVTAAAQENSAGAKAIEDMVVRIRTLAMEPKGKTMRVTEELVKWYLEKEEADKINRRIAERRKKKANG